MGSLPVGLPGPLELIADPTHEPDRSAQRTLRGRGALGPGLRGADLLKILKLLRGSGERSGQTFSTRLSVFVPRRGIGMRVAEAMSEALSYQPLFSPTYQTSFTSCGPSTSVRYEPSGL